MTGGASSPQPSLSAFSSRRYGAREVVLPDTRVGWYAGFDGGIAGFEAGVGGTVEALDDEYLAPEASPTF